MFHRWRIDHKDFSIVAAVLDEELLCNHRGDDRFAETHDIGEEEAIIANQFLVALNHSVHLILKLFIAFGHVKGVVLVNGQHTV